MRLMRRLMMNKRLFIHKRGLSWASTRGRQRGRKDQQEINLPQDNQLIRMMEPHNTPGPGNLKSSPQEGDAAGQKVNTKIL